jgi:hypothetical protein
LATAFSLTRTERLFNDRRRGKLVLPLDYRGSAMTEPPIEGPDPSEQPPPEPDPPAKRSIWPLYLVLGIVALAIVGYFGNRALYSSDFDRLVDLTAAAEGHQVWRDFFIAQDCFVVAVIDDQNPGLAYTDGLELLDETVNLADHVDRALGDFSTSGVKGWHEPLVEARDAIAAHYQVWDDHLVGAEAILGTLSEEAAELVVTFQAWADSVVQDQDSIAETFEDAETAFTAAAPSPGAATDVDRMFTSSTVSCTRGSV